MNQDRKQHSDRLRGAALATERRAESTGIASSSEISCSSQGLCVVCGQTELHQRILQVGLSGSRLQPGGVTSKQDHSSEYLEIKTKQGQWWISMTNVEGHVVSLGRWGLSRDICYLCHYCLCSWSQDEATLWAGLSIPGSPVLALAPFLSCCF